MKYSAPLYSLLSFHSQQQFPLHYLCLFSLQGQIYLSLCGGLSGGYYWPPAHHLVVTGCISSPQAARKLWDSPAEALPASRNVQTAEVEFWQVFCREAKYSECTKCYRCFLSAWCLESVYIICFRELIRNEGYFNWIYQVSELQGFLYAWFSQLIWCKIQHTKCKMHFSG